PTDISIDSSNNMFIGGYFYNGPVKNLDYFLMKVNSTGYFFWQEEWGGTGNDICRGVTLDSNENVYITGSTSSLGNGLDDIFIIKYSNFKGIQLYNSTWGGSSNDVSLALISDSADNIYIIGYTSSFGAGSSDLLLLKSPPFYEINIIFPNKNQFFSSTSPTFQIDINPQFTNRWYTLNGGIPYNFSGTIGSINQTEWNLWEDGEIVIDFYANDSFGDIISGRVTIKKDTTIPQISINSPHPNQLFGNLTLDFDINIIEDNLNSTWFTLNDGLKNKFSGTNGTISQEVWDLCENGTVSIKFYANDSVGNSAFDEVIVRKETSFPLITIISPNHYQLYGEELISFDLAITSSSIDYRWYTLNGGSKYFFSGLSEVINQDAWEICGNGSILIKFYANNSAGNIAFENVIVHKDILDPLISILSPIENQIFSNSTFDFSLAIIEGNLNSTWYSLDGGLTNYLFV
ncbi:hypothetical protein LCGC14_2614010, partial [marine sediment metagenome]